MPSIFKALASISAWILFGSGCVGIVTSSVRRITMGEAVAETALVAWAIAVASFALAVVVMRLRQKME